MGNMNIAILQFPGTNCEYDTKYAFEKLGANVKFCWHKDTSLPQDTDLVVIAGGFSYGDYLRSGAIAKFSPVMKAVSLYAKDGGKVLGICNGFRILVESNLLPGALKRNENLHFISKHHYLKVENNDIAQKTISMLLTLHEKVLMSKEETLKTLKEENEFLKYSVYSIQEVYESSQETIKRLQKQLEICQEELEFCKRKYKLMWNKAIDDTVGK